MQMSKIRGGETRPWSLWLQSQEFFMSTEFIKRYWDTGTARLQVQRQQKGIL